MPVSPLKPAQRRDALRRATALVSAFVAAAVLVGAEALGRGQQDRPIATVTQQFRTELDRMRTSLQFPGATAAFALPDGRCIGIAVGVADRESQLPMAMTSRMPAGSVGKTFTSAVALSLVGEGKLALDDRIEKWIGTEPWFARLPNARQITVRMLLNHTSGLPDHVYDKRFIEWIRGWISSPNFDADRVVSPRDLIEYVLDKPPLFPAGDRYAYTDTGYILAGVIIERATRSTYYTELQRRFLDRLALRLTAPANRRDIRSLATGYVATDNPFGLPTQMVRDGKMVINPVIEWAGGGLVSNPQDLARWAKLLYEGRAMRQPYLKELLRSVPRGANSTHRYGLGVDIASTPWGPAHGHDGWFPGYLTKVAYFPERQVALAVQLNTDVNIDSSRLLDTLAPIVLDASLAR